VNLADRTRVRRHHSPFHRPCPSAVITSVASVTSPFHFWEGSRERSSGNIQIKSFVENPARYVDKEDKIGGVVIMSALFGPDLPGRRHRSSFFAERYPEEQGRGRIVTTSFSLMKGEQLFAMMTSPSRENLDLSDIFAYVDQHCQEFLERLTDYVRRPSISAYGQGIGEVAEYIAGVMNQLGLEARIMPTAGWPMVLGARIERPGAPTVLLYGHYDVQPPDPLLVPALGGSLPDYVFTKILGIPAFTVPYADESNHAPNENLEVERFFRGIKTGSGNKTGGNCQDRADRTSERNPGREHYAHADAQQHRTRDRGSGLARATSDLYQWHSAIGPSLGHGGGAQSLRVRG
jgi:hypothetical protein